MKMHIEGVIVPLITPMDQDGALNTGPVKRLVDYLIARGICAFLTCGTTGEGTLLTVEERCQFSEAVVKAAGGRIPVIVHSGSITTAETIYLTKHAKEIGAQAAAMIPPYYFHYSDEELTGHFETVARQAPDFPLYLYNNPPVTNNTLSIEVVSRVVERCPNVVGIKNSSTLELLVACSRLRDGAFNTANGCDDLILASRAVGGEACVSGNANVLPELVVELFSACSSGDLKRARELQARLDAAAEIMGGGKISLFKAMLAKRGVAVGGVRKPMMQDSEEVIEACWQGLLDVGVCLDAV